MKFIHLVVFDKDDFYKGHYDTGDWWDLTDGDYVVHALYDCEAGSVVLVNDNTHTDIESQIDCFIKGIRYTNTEVQLTNAYTIVDGDPYSFNLITEAMLRGEYVEVNL